MALSEVQESRVRFRAASQEQMQAQRAELNRSAEERKLPRRRRAPSNAPFLICGNLTNYFTVF